MKSIGFHKQLRMFRVNGLLRRASSGIPICAKCNKPIEVVEIKDRGPDPDAPLWMEIYARCHGQEDYSRVEFPTPCYPHMWGSVISTGQFFLDRNGVQE